MGGCWALQAISQAHIVNNDGVVVRLRLCCKGGMEVNLTNNQTITLYLVYLTWKSLQYCILNKSLINTSTLQQIVWQTITILLKILILFYSSLKKGNNIFKIDINFPSFVYLSTRTHYPEPTSFSLMLHTWQRSNKYQFYSFWFDPTHDLPHSRRAR